MTNPNLYELVQPWWDVDAEPGAKWRDRAGGVWTKRNNGLWSVHGPGLYTALELDGLYGPGELVTPEPEPIPEPTAPGVVVRGTIDGKTVRAVRAAKDVNPWVIYGEGIPWPRWYSWEVLLVQFDTTPAIIDTDQLTGLTEEQREAVKVAAHALAENGISFTAAGLREAFPEVFEPEPERPWDEADLKPGDVVVFNLDGEKTISASQDWANERRRWTRDAGRITDWQFFRPTWTLNTDKEN